MRRLDRILCGLLTVVWLVECATPQAAHKPAVHSSISPSDDASRHTQRSEESFRELASLKIPKFLQLRSLSLDKWGSKTTPVVQNSSTLADHHHGTYFFNTFEKTEIFESQLINMLAGTIRRPVNHEVRNALFMILVIVILVCFLVFVFESSGSEEEEEGYFSKEEFAAMEARARQKNAELEFTFENPNQPRTPFPELPRQEEEPMPLQEVYDTVSFSDGSWARAYRDAVGERKEALELLFRCNIISTQEFAYSRVSQEHINECVWIGTHMLRQQPLEEWVALWQQAQQTFEDSVTACFTARTDARSAGYGPMPIFRSDPDLPMLDFQSGHTGEDRDLTYTTRSSLMLDSDMQSPHSQFQDPSLGTPRAQAADIDRGGTPGERSFGEPSPSQRNLSPLILRCREIVAAPPQEGVPERSPVMRNTSLATTAPVGAASRQNSSATWQSTPPTGGPDPTPPAPAPSREPSEPLLPSAQRAALEASLLQESGVRLRPLPRPEQDPEPPKLSPRGSPRSSPRAGSAAGDSSKDPSPLNRVRIKTLADSQSGGADRFSTSAQAMFPSLDLPRTLPPRVVVPPMLPQASDATRGSSSKGTSPVGSVSLGSRPASVTLPAALPPPGTEDQGRPVSTSLPPRAFDPFTAPSREFAVPQTNEFPTVPPTREFPTVPLTREFPTVPQTRDFSDSSRGGEYTAPQTRDFMLDNYPEPGTYQFMPAEPPSPMQSPAVQQSFPGQSPTMPVRGYP